LMELVSSCIFLSQVLSCLSNNSSVFPLISISSSSSESLSSDCSSLLEWPPLCFVFLFHSFFLRFSISWVTSSLIFQFSSLIHLSLCLWCFQFQFGVYLGLLCIHLFVFVFSHILYFFCLGIS
jgi:hypothetical protein